MQILLDVMAGAAGTRCASRTFLQSASAAHSKELVRDCPFSSAAIGPGLERTRLLLTSYGAV